MRVFEALKADLDARDAKGRAEYGKELLTFDGRDTLQDAFEESLDLAVYLKKARMEREAVAQVLSTVGEVLRVLPESMESSWQNCGVVSVPISILVELKRTAELAGVTVCRS